MSVDLRYGEGPKAWNIYAQQLYHHGHGYPLWQPDPDPSATEVQIGDVGWVKQGGFLQLFNARKKADEKQLRDDAPEGYVPFDHRNLIITGPNETVTEPPLCSHTVQTYDVTTAASASSLTPVPAGGGASFNFKCTENQGAFLMFFPACYSTEIESKRHIVNYMREHFARWVEFSDKYGLDLKEQDILFVCGTTKTTRWAVAAFNGNYKKKSGSVSADLGSVTALNLSVSISNEMLPQSYHKFGPKRSLTTAPSTPLLEGTGARSSTPAYGETNDQCIFIHYYKMKRRIWGTRYMKAAAGPHELPPPGPDDAELEPVPVGDVDDSVEFEQIPETEKPFDPVNDLLDYILQNSEASIAIASDRDIFALFKGQDFPINIQEALVQVKPTIEVDEHGVGTVSVQIDYSHKRRIEEHIAQSEQIDEPLDVPLEPIAVPDDTGPPDVPADNDAPAEDDDKMTSKRFDLGAPASIHDGSITALAYSHDGRYAASGSEDTNIIVWNVRANTMMYKKTGHAETVTSLAFSRDNTLLASSSNDQAIIIRKVSNGQELKRLEPGVAIHSITFSPDSLKLIAGAYDGSLRLWDTQTYEPLPVVQKHLAVITFIVFSADGHLMATGGTESDCLIWETAHLQQGEPHRVLRGHKGMVCSAAFSPDGRRIITASDDGSSRIWNAETGEALVLLHEHSGPVWTVAFSPDGKRVASGSSDSTVKVCDSFDGSRLLSLDGHDDMVNVVEFSPDGKYIASAASDNTVRLWSASDGATVATFNEHDDNATTVLFSPDGSTLASGSHDGTVRIRQIITA